MTAPTTTTADPDVLTATEVARALRIHPNTVYRRIVAGDIPVVPCGRNRRIPRVWLDEQLRVGDGTIAPAAAAAPTTVALIDAGTFT